jgi:HAD superfamily hydrolase (TIGR01490 family)
MTKAAAFFDFDKTLLAHESAKLGFRMVWEAGLVSPWYLLKLTAADKFYKRGLVSAETMADLCLEYYRGRDLTPFIAGAPKFYREWIKPHLSPALLAKVEEHRRLGHVLVLLSASVDYYLRPVQEELGFDHLLCTELERDASGICTGRTKGPVVVGAQKRTVAEEFARAAGVDLAASYAYGDHHSDAALLESVGHPVAVRPTRRLRRLAQARGWPIIDAR